MPAVDLTPAQGLANLGATLRAKKNTLTAPDPVILALLVRLEVLFGQVRASTLFGPTLGPPVPQDSLIIH